MRRIIFYAIIVALALSLVVGIVVHAKRNMPKKLPGVAGGEKKYESSIASVINARVVRGEYDIQNAFIKVADEVGKAVVAISTERTRKIAMRRPGMLG